MTNLFDIRQQTDFKPSKADPDKWMKLSKDGTYYEYIAVYVDDLAICMQDLKHFVIPSKRVQTQAERCWPNQLPSWMWIHQR